MKNKRKVTTYLKGRIYETKDGAGPLAQIYINGVQHRKRCKTMIQAKGWIYLKASSINKPLTPEEVEDVLKARQFLPEGVTFTDAIKAYSERLHVETRVSVEKAIKTFLESKETDNLRPSSLKSLKVKLGHLEKHLSGRLVSEVQPKDLEEIRSSKSWAPKTWNNVKGDWGSFFIWCKSRGLISKNPTENMGKARVDQQLAAIYTPEETKALLDAINKVCPHFLPVFAIGFFAGLRTAELFALDWQAVASDHIHVNAAIAKTRFQRLVTIPDNLRLWLADHPASGKVAPSTAHNFRHHYRPAVLKAAGLSSMPANAIRHSYASYHLALHQSAGKTALEMGNSEGKIFSNYRNIVTKDQAKAYFEVKP